MTAKLPPDALTRMLELHHAGKSPKEIALLLGCAAGTVVRYLNSNGIILGNKGSKNKVAEYMPLAKEMRAAGYTWMEVGAEIGFHPTTFYRELNRTRED